MFKRIIAACAVLVGGAVVGPQAHAQTCGPVTIADMNWSSASLIAHVDAFILRHAFECDTSLVTGDTMPTGTSMVEKGAPDIAPEFWSSNFKAALAQGIEEKRLSDAGTVFFEGGDEGFWVPKYMVDAKPELATIAGVKANAALFVNDEDPDRSAFVGCPAGWGCQLAVNNLFVALDMDQAGFDVIDPGSGAALAGSIARAYEREKPWFGYYWSPTPVLGRYDMVKVDFGSGVDADHFYGCLATEDCANPKVSMFPPSPVKTLTTYDFAQRAPAAYAYLQARNYKNADMSRLLAWMEDEQADGEIAMAHFLTEYAGVWQAWLTETQVEKVASALESL